MISFRKAAVLGGLLPFLVVTHLLAQRGLPRIEGNRGVPGLLAEIDSLETELAATKSELAETESELAETESDLAATESELADTQAELAATQAELSDTRSELEATQALLAQIQAELAATNELLDSALNDLVEEQKRYRVPQTGQSDCWDAASNDPDDPHFPIPCVFTGQDGEHAAGLAPPPVRFVDNGDGSITDLFTKLVWLRNGSCAEGLSWDEAVAFGRAVNGMLPTSRCGLQDGTAQGVWRLPNVQEFMSLVDFGSTGLPGNHPFNGVVGRFFWTSTTYAVPPNSQLDLIQYPCVVASHGYGQDNLDRFNEAYVVHLGTGETLHIPKDDEDSISRRHDRDDPLLGTCDIEGFRNGTPKLRISPGFIAVRDLIE